MFDFVRSHALPACIYIPTIRTDKNKCSCCLAFGKSRLFDYGIRRQLIRVAWLLLHPGCIVEQLECSVATKTSDLLVCKFN